MTKGERNARKTSVCGHSERMLTIALSRSGPTHALCPSSFSQPLCSVTRRASQGKPWWHGPLPAAPHLPHAALSLCTTACLSRGNHVRFHGPRRYSLSFSSHGRAWAPLSSGRSPPPARGLERSLLKRGLICQSPGKELDTS